MHCCSAGSVGASTFCQYGRLTRETTANGTILTYAHDQQGLRSITANGQTYYYHYNHRGDTLALTNTTGQTAVAYTYTPWGEQTATGDPNLITANRFTYNGQDGVEYDIQTDLYWMHARWYNPTQHRFISTDPMPSLAGTADNPYALTANDPINLIDPAGTSIIFTRRTPTTTQPAPSILPTGIAWSATPVYVPLTIAPLPHPDPPIPPAPTPGLWLADTADQGPPECPPGPHSCMSVAGAAGEYPEGNGCNVAVYGLKKASGKAQVTGDNICKVAIRPYLLMNQLQVCLGVSLTEAGAKTWSCNRWKTSVGMTVKDTKKSVCEGRANSWFQGKAKGAFLYTQESELGIPVVVAQTAPARTTASKQVCK